MKAKPFKEICYKFGSYLHVLIGVGEQDEMSTAIDALARMRHLRHLLFETRPRAAMGEIVAACLRRMPLLRRCGPRVHLRHSEEYLLSYDGDVFLSHDVALRQQTASGDPPFQLLQELFFHHFPDEPPGTISDDVLRMPNLRTLVLRLLQWRPKMLHLLQNVTDLSLVSALKRADALQLFNAVGPQLTKLFLFHVSLFFCNIYGEIGRVSASKGLKREPELYQKL
jgi:hypothetical protein